LGVLLIHPFIPGEYDQINSFRARQRLNLFPKTCVTDSEPFTGSFTRLPIIQEPTTIEHVLEVSHFLLLLRSVCQIPGPIQLIASQIEFTILNGLATLDEYVAKLVMVTCLNMCDAGTAPQEAGTADQDRDQSMNH